MQMAAHAAVGTTPDEALLQTYVDAQQVRT